MSQWLPLFCVFCPFCICPCLLPRSLSSRPLHFYGYFQSFPFTTWPPDALRLSHLTPTPNCSHFPVTPSVLIPAHFHLLHATLSMLLCAFSFQPPVSEPGSDIWTCRLHIPSCLHLCSFSYGLISTLWQDVKTRQLWVMTQNNDD